MAEEKKLPEIEGYCRFCKKPIYTGLARHELICQFEKRYS